jgi:hypothetical protein
MAPLLREFIILMAIMATATLAAAQPAREGRTKSGIAYDIQGKGPVVVAGSQWVPGWREE